MTRRLAPIAAVFLVLLAVACGNDAATTGSTEPLVVGGSRPVTVQIPESYDPSQPAPLLILLHGYTDTGAGAEAYFGFAPVAEAHGIIHAHPDGTVNPEGSRFWNATDACCDFYGSGVDDSAYLIGLVDEISEHLAVDPKRIYFFGDSNGNFMAFRMACDHSDRVAAIAGLAGAMFADASRCAATSPVSMLHIHGTADEVILWDGGFIEDIPYPGAIESVADWGAINGCDPASFAEGTANRGLPFDLDPTIRGDETTPYSGDCPEGVDVSLWVIDGGSHIPALADDFAGRVIEYLLSHPKP